MHGIYTVNCINMINDSHFILYISTYTHIYITYIHIYIFQISNAMSIVCLFIKLGIVFLKMYLLLLLIFVFFLFHFIFLSTIIIISYLHKAGDLQNRIKQKQISNFMVPSVNALNNKLIIAHLTTNYVHNFYRSAIECRQLNWFYEMNKKKMENKTKMITACQLQQYSYRLLWYLFIRLWIFVDFLKTL